MPMSALVIDKTEREVPQIILALGSACRLSCRLYRRKQQAYQDADDRDYDQQLNQGEAALSSFHGGLVPATSVISIPK